MCPSCPTTGSHTVLQLLDNGYSVVIMDNLRNSFPKAFEHMKRIAGDKADKMKFIKVSTHAASTPASTHAAAQHPHLVRTRVVRNTQQQQHHQQPPPSRTMLLNASYPPSSAMGPVPSPKQLLTSAQLWC